MMRRSPSFDNFEFDDLFDRMSRQFEEMSRQFDGTRSFGREMAVDLREDAESFVAIVDLPGFEKSDIDLMVTDETLTIEATRSEASDEESEHYVHRERRSDAVRRSIRLPSSVRADDASATYNNGVLSVTLPKLHVEDEDAHHIDVE
ncbi:Hsp20/alpha crystallin family protein [Halobellus captivus]|uniref:Hsp20/alpha crystallin family protein n=1 Tax=Halobellus captivus TaxID=2592614 RepID=UPI0011A37D8E|nr:Hsp20/alpha crystallin family protein [Halobellus captivus]